MRMPDQAPGRRHPAGPATDREHRGGQRGESIAEFGGLGVELGQQFRGQAGRCARRLADTTSARAGRDHAQPVAHGADRPAQFGGDASVSMAGSVGDQRRADDLDGIGRRARHHDGKTRCVAPAGDTSGPSRPDRNSAVEQPDPPHRCPGPRPQPITTAPTRQRADSHHDHRCGLPARAGALSSTGIRPKGQPVLPHPIGLSTADSRRT